MLRLFGEGLRFGLHPRSWLPLFVVDFAFFLAGLGMVLSGGSAALAAIAGTLVQPAFGATVIATLSGLLVLAVLWGLVKAWVCASVVLQADKKRPLATGLSAALRRYPGALVTLLLVSVLATGALGLGPLGIALSIILNIVFFTAFVRSVGGSGPLTAVSRSARQARTRLPRTVGVWLGTIVASTVIVVIFLFPLLFYIGAVSALLAQAGVISGASSQLAVVATLLSVLLANALAVALLAAILLVGTSVAKAFALGVQARYSREAR